MSVLGRRASSCWSSGWDLRRHLFCGGSLVHIRREQKFIQSAEHDNWCLIVCFSKNLLAFYVSQDVTLNKAIFWLFDSLLVTYLYTHICSNAFPFHNYYFLIFLSSHFCNTPYCFVSWVIDNIYVNVDGHTCHMPCDLPCHLPCYMYTKLHSYKAI